jgi:hypothetical protein
MFFLRFRSLCFPTIPMLYFNFIYLGNFRRITIENLPEDLHFNVYIFKT